MYVKKNNYLWLLYKNCKRNPSITGFSLNSLQSYSFVRQLWNDDDDDDDTITIMQFHWMNDNP